MKNWQHKLALFNAAMFFILSTVLFILLFILSPVNRSYQNDEQIKEQFMTLYGFDSCERLDSLVLNNRYYRAVCTRDGQRYQTYFSDEDKGVYQLEYDASFDRDHVQRIQSLYNFTGQRYRFIFKDSKVMLWIKYDKGELLIDTNTDEIVMKVELDYE